MDELLLKFAVKGLVAFGCGFLIGLERELKGKSAGLRTSVLICIGSALFTGLGYDLTTKFGSGDPTRVFAQIVSGIGFLGAGVILQSNGAIFGLTTASTIWITSAIGVAVGVGYNLVAVFATVMTVLTLVILKYFENQVLHRFNLVRNHFNLDMEFDEGRSIDDLEVKIKASGLKIHARKVSLNEGIVKANYRLEGKCFDNEKLVQDLIKSKMVKAISSQKV